MRFIDDATVRVRSGAGGDGCVSFRREKFVPRGGPNGGDGGDGGSVVVIGKGSLQTLADLEYRHSYRAGRGQHGMGKDRHGRNGEGVRIPVPLGTDVFNKATGERIGEVLSDGQELIVARGGKGGRGNARFVSSTNQSPRNAEPGGEAVEMELRLVLRLVADIGFVGLPNAGKSTLLSALTSANPKVAAYPFTTLAPNLGVMTTRDLRFTVADMPGIIEGAHEGKGLGLRFLRHIERTRLLVFVVDLAAGAPAENYQLLCDEIREYDATILGRPRVLALNKIDLVGEVPRLELDLPVVPISAFRRTAIGQLKAEIERLLPRRSD